MVTAASGLLRGPAEVCGNGFLTGAEVQLRFLPAPPGTGIVFVRTDLQPAAVIPAHANRVTGTARRTTLGHAPASVGLVEHVLAALAGLRIDNCRIELDAPEPPGLDGSAQGFADALSHSGIVLQDAWRPVWAADSPVTVQQGGATLTLHPPEDGRTALTVSYLLDYGPYSPPGRQSHSQEITPGRFLQDLACCRTFLLEAEASALKRQGIGLRTTAADLIVFGPRGPIGNRLRFANEPARHKALDIVGDLALTGADLAGHVVGYRSGHPLNVELARTLCRAMAQPLPQVA